MQGRRRRDTPYDASKGEAEAKGGQWKAPVVEVDPWAVEVVDAEDVPKTITTQVRALTQSRTLRGCLGAAI
jgi:hypothetical protein